MKIVRSTRCSMKFANESKLTKLEKECPKCGIEHNTRQSYCLACMTEYRKEWRNREGNRKKAVIQSAAWKSRNPTKAKAADKIAKLKKKYSIGREVYLSLIDIQGGCCPICGNIIDPWSSDTTVDHCHATGEVRGVLHNKCNRLLSCAEDDELRLKNAIEYLKDYGAGFKPLDGGSHV